jgi:hypothetical protein
MSVPTDNTVNRKTSTLVARRGTTLLELLVAFTLMMATLGLSVPLVVRHGRLLTEADHYRIALDELTNQLERLRGLSPAEVSQQLQGLKPSELAAERLVGAKLAGNVESGESGRRVKLRLSWDEPQRREFPVELVAWLPREDAAETDAGGPRSQP